MPMSRSLKRMIALTAALIAVAVAVTIAMVLRDEPDPLLGTVRTPAQKVGQVQLTDVSEKDDGPVAGVVPAGRDLNLVYFGFTTCPDICPTTLADLGSAIRELPANDRERVNVVLITVDPKRDDGEMMRNYLSHFFESNPSQALRTDDPDRLAEAERAFGASHKTGKPKRDGSYDVSHTAYTYAVDRSGEVVVQWPFATLPEDISHDLRMLLDD